jgi:hypothetical protein
VPWFSPPVDTQFFTNGSVGEMTIVYTPPTGVACTLFRLVCSFQ